MLTISRKPKPGEQLQRGQKRRIAAGTASAARTAPPGRIPRSRGAPSAAARARNSAAGAHRHQRLDARELRGAESPRSDAPRVGAAAARAPGIRRSAGAQSPSRDRRRTPAPAASSSGDATAFRFNHRRAGHALHLRLVDEATGPLRPPAGMPRPATPSASRGHASRGLTRDQPGARPPRVQLRVTAIESSAPRTAARPACAAPARDAPAPRRCRSASSKPGIRR